MGLFALFGNRLGRYFYARRSQDSLRRFQPAPLSPQRLEKRRVLDAGAVEFLLSPLAESGEFVQTGEALSSPGSVGGQDSNQSPAHVQLFLGESEILENDELQLGVTFASTNYRDPHKITIDWGDGSSLETYILEPGARFLGTCHQYLDDNPTSTAADLNTIKVTVFDAAGSTAMATAAVTVNNVAPTIETLSITSPIVEGQVATLTGTFSDPGTQDTYLLEIDWDGDNTFDQTIEVSGGEFTASRLFPDDNPSGTLSDTHKVTVRLHDDDGGSDVKSVPLTVVDESPRNVQFDPVAAIDENGFAQIRVTFDDPGLEDTHFARINWGDGSPLERIDLEPGERSVVATHQYLEDSLNESNGTYTIRVGIINDDRGIGRTPTEILVKNVEPVLTVAADQEVDEGALLDLTGGGLGSFTDVGTLDTHTATVNWGDGSPTQAATVNQSSGSGTLDGSHRYADNGVYTVTVVLRDDDGGETVKRFRVHVKNVDPTLAGTEPIPIVKEGEAFSLADLGITLKDPGFDNPLNPNYEELGSVETFTAATINWGDGTAVEALGVINRVSGGIEIDTTAEFERLEHTFADNGLYTVTITVGDDDGGLVMRTFKIQVDNVAPSLSLTERELLINEGETLNLFDLGEFSDPGFNNPLNVIDASNGGEVVESFSYTIDWGDGTVETGQLPATVLNGSVDQKTLGTLVDSHQYLDNDSDNLYTITVTLADDDGGTVTRTITAKVLNVNPTLIPIISAADVNTRGETTIVIEFADPGTETLTVWVDWGDKLALPPADRYVPETAVVGPGTSTLTLQHKYTGPPDPTSPASDINISVFVRDDDFGFPLVVDPGQSETQTVAISNPGVGGNPVVIDTTPQVPRLLFPRQEETMIFDDASSSNVGGVQTIDLRTAVGDTKSTTDRYLELRVIDPATGEEGEGYRLKAEVLDDLPGLFQSLPDNRYAIYLVRTETNTRRLVIEVYVRNGKLIDPGDDSEGTRDRPPTDQADQGVRDSQPEDEPILNPARPEAGEINDEAVPSEPGSSEAENPAAEQDAMLPTGDVRTRMLLGASLLGLAASKSGSSWAERIDKALAAADAKKWHHLRRRLIKRDNPNNQKNG